MIEDKLGEISRELGCSIEDLETILTRKRIIEELNETKIVKKYEDFLGMRFGQTVELAGIEKDRYDRGIRNFVGFKFELEETEPRVLLIEKYKGTIETHAIAAKHCMEGRWGGIGGMIPKSSNKYKFYNKILEKELL